MSDQIDDNGKSSVQASNNSNAISGDIEIGGTVQVGGDVHIGHTIGYTAEQVSTLITQIQTTFQPKPFDGRCPYKGLDVFEEEDAELFFGREKVVEDLVSRVKESRTVFITGPSGSGKSSLVRAGLIHALKQGSLKNSEGWLYETMKPGRDPIEALGRVVSGLAGTTNAEDEIRSKAPADASIFARWSEIALKEGRDKRLVLFIDQFEEVFTQIGKEEERLSFLNVLTHAANVEKGRVVILFSMRSDFVPNCATYPQLNALLNKQFVQIGAMQPEELVSAIAQPALRVGLRIDPDLIAQVIDDMKGEPGALPLMQFALKDLFDSVQSKGGMIALTLNDYLQRGGIQKSLERHADAAFAGLGLHEQELARSIFSGLIEVGRGTQDTKRTAIFDELIPSNAKAEEIEAIVQKLADARLITTSEAGGKDTVTISHEKLIDAWPWLRKLVNENRDVIALQNEIAGDAKEWEGHKRDTSYLYTGGRLANVREQLGAKKLVLSGAANEFIQSGYRKQCQGQMLRIFSVATVIGLVIIGVLVFSYQSAANSKKLAEQGVSFGSTQQAIALTSQAYAEQAATAQVNAEEQAKIALARQLIAQAKSIAPIDYDQTTAILLAVHSMQIFPLAEASEFLQISPLKVPITGIAYDGPVYSVAFSPDGRYLASGSLDATACVWDISNGKEITCMIHDDAVWDIAFSPDGKYISTASRDGIARLWEVDTGAELARMSPASSALFSSNGKYIGSKSGKMACIWDIPTGQRIACMTHNGVDASVMAIAFSSDNQYLVTGSGDRSARVWEVNKGSEIARMTHDNFVSSVAISPDGKYVVSGSGDNTARVWETVSGREVSRMTHQGAVWDVAFSPDGRYVVSGSEDATARVWEATTGKEIARLAQSESITDVMFSPDGQYIMSGSDDGTVRIWDISTHYEIYRMIFGDSISSLAISPDGKYAAGGSYDSVARAWVWRPSDLIMSTCSRLTRNLTRAEWKQYLVDKPYQPICTDLPPEPEPTPAPTRTPTSP